MENNLKTTYTFETSSVGNFIFSRMFLFGFNHLYLDVSVSISGKNYVYSN